MVKDKVLEDGIKNDIDFLKNEIYSIKALGLIILAAEVIILTIILILK